MYREVEKSLNLYSMVKKGLNLYSVVKKKKTEGVTVLIETFKEYLILSATTKLTSRLN